MDLQEQRITCLRMAVDMGCKADSVLGTASELMGFVTSGAVPSAVMSPAVEAVSTSVPECVPSPDEAAAAPEAEVASSAPPAIAAAPVEAAKPAEGLAAAAEVREPVSPAMVADAPAAEAESAAQPELSSGEGAMPAVEAIPAVEAASSPPAEAAPLPEPILAEQPASSVAIAENAPAAVDAAIPDASTEAPPPKTNGAAKADAASAAPTAT
jgi:hypothetical protein